MILNNVRNSMSSWRRTLFCFVVTQSSVTDGAVSLTVATCDWHSQFQWAVIWKATAYRIRAWKSNDTFSSENEFSKCFHLLVNLSEMKCRNVAFTCCNPCQKLIIVEYWNTFLITVSHNSVSGISWWCGGGSSLICTLAKLGWCEWLPDCQR